MPSTKSVFSILFTGADKPMHVVALDISEAMAKAKESGVNKGKKDVFIKKVEFVCEIDVE